MAADRSRMAALALLVALIGVMALWSMSIGRVGLSFAEVASALGRFDGSREHLIVMTVRLPRLLAGLFAGAALAVAGALMQALTNNPLASPGLLGINAGAAFAIVLALTVAGPAASGFYVWCAFLGAAAASVAVYVLGSMGASGATPLKLALAGAILSAFVGSLTTAVLIFDSSTLDVIRLWSVGSLEGRSLGNVAMVAPYILTGLASALLFRRQITTMSLGADLARGVGQNLLLWRLLAGAMVVLLAGSAVALAGPIGFVGLFVPHAARLLAGVDYRWIIPFSALGGALVVTASDSLLRQALPDRDIPVGIAMALIGAPFFIHLARGRAGRSVS